MDGEGSGSGLIVSVPLIPILGLDIFLPGHSPPGIPAKSAHVGVPGFRTVSAGSSQQEECVSYVSLSSWTECCYLTRSSPPNLPRQWRALLLLACFILGVLRSKECITVDSTLSFT